ncbi:tetratricopeptide repeat protein [Patescibacteria group bacterium]|nr:tetratricopeptide repeat protein [Patescibacteria group bacterium]
MFNLLPPIIIVVAVAILIVLIVRRFPRVEDEKELDTLVSEKKKEEEEKKQKERVEYKEQPIADIKKEAELGIGKQEEDSTEKEAVHGSAQPSSPSFELSVEDSQKEKKDDREDVRIEKETERAEALKTKKEMHKNVLKVIDRVSYLGKRGISGVKSAGSSAVKAVRVGKAKLAKKNKPESLVSGEKVVDLLERGAKDLGAGNFGEAEKKYIEVIKMNPRNTRAYKGLAEVFEKQKNYTDAISSLRQVEKLDPLDYEVGKKITELQSKLKSGIGVSSTKSSSDELS